MEPDFKQTVGRLHRNGPGCILPTVTECYLDKDTQP